MLDREHFLPAVLRALDAKVAAQLSFEAAVRGAQAICPHDEVLEAPSYKVCTDGGRFQAQRVCRKCGLHEHGGYGSKASPMGSGEWAATSGVYGESWYGNRSKTRLLTDFVMPCRPNDIHKYAIGVPPLAKP